LIAQAGGIVFRNHQSSPRVLLVRSKRNPKEWIFPKGHIEAGETAREAALRETHEEAGAVGAVVDHVEAVQFESARGTIEVEYYLIAWSGDKPSPEERERRWCTVEEASELLEFPGAQGLLRKALRKWQDDRASRLP
jgi:diadenosine hexaphosphate hydrolase (ATP-forming)